MPKLRGLVALVLVVVGMVGGGAPARASDYLDPTFDGDGAARLVAEVDNVPANVQVVDTWRMDDGRIVAAGEVGSLSACDLRKWWVGRFTAEGAPDPTFGGGTGEVQFLPPGINPCFSAGVDPLRLGSVAVQSTGKVVLGGGPNFLLVRLNADGTLDPTLNRPFFPPPPSAGSVPQQCVPFDLPRSGGEVWDLAIDPVDDAVVAAGRVARRAFMSGCPSSTRWFSGPGVVRVDEDGYSTLTGPWSAATTTLPEIRKVALLSDGTPVVAAGTSLHWIGDVQLTVPDVYEPASDPDNDIVGLVVDGQDRVTLATLYGDYDTIALHRFAGGVADPSFGDGGEVLESAIDRVAAVAVDSADRLVLVGAYSPLQVARLSEAGALDPTFGDGGIRTDAGVYEPFEDEEGTPYEEGPYEIGPLAGWVGPGDQPVIFGRAWYDDDYYAVGRYLADGTPDATLHDNGFRFTPITVTIPTEANAKITELEVTPSGDVFALLGTDLVKWRADGALDLAFGGNGRVERPSDRSFTHFALDPNGDVVVSGNRFGGANDGWVGRFDGATGTRDAGFGTDGAVYFTQRRTDEVGVDSAGRPIVAVTDSNPTSRKLIRLGVDGTADSTFGTGGSASVPIPFVAGIVVDDSDRAVVASSNGIDIVRYTPSGALDPSFQRTLVTGNLQELLVDTSDRVIAISTGTYAATRILSTGGLDTSFGEAGRLREPNGLDDPHGALDASDRVLFVGKKTNTNDVDVVRYTTAGVLDTTYANGGRARLRPALEEGRALRDSDDVLADVDGSGHLVVSARTARPSTYTTKQVVTVFRLVPEPPADTGAPEITITTPIDGATYLSTDGLVADFACADPGSGIEFCSGSPGDGIPFDMWPGPHTFTVTARDFAGISTSSTIEFSVLHAASSDVAAGGSVETGYGYADFDKLDTRVTTPNAGLVTIVERPGTVSPAGYELLGMRADVTAPAASPAQPLQLTFWLHSSLLGALDADTVQVFRDGALVPPCDDPPSGVAAPDPCVAARETTGTGNARLDIRTSAASTWTFGRMLDTTPPSITITSPADGADFTLGQVVTADYACADAGSGVASCSGPVAVAENIDTATAGTRTFTVTAADAAGNTASEDHTYHVLAGSVTATATGPAIVTTDPGGLGASPTIPVQTRLDVPNGATGLFSLAAEDAGTVPVGYVALPTAVDTTGPAAAAPSSPHVLTFAIDASLLGELAPAQVDVVADGAVLAACAGPTDAAPDPCVAGRAEGTDGDLVVTVRSTDLTTWTFARRSFIATSATPASRAQATTAQTVVVTGDGFVAGATAKVSGSGVTVSSTTWVSPTSLRLTLSVAGSAALGARNITVTNPNAATAVCTGCFTVTAKPTVTALSPNSRPRGTSGAVLELTGTGLQDGAAVSFSGAGITVDSVTFVDPTRLRLNVSIDAAAATGARAVTVVNPDGGTATRSAVLTVNALPAITTVAPSQLRQGQTLNVVINGSGFPANFVAAGGTVAFGDGVTVGTIVRNSLTKLTASVTVDAATAPGGRSITVTNPDTGSVTCTACATVVADPQIADVAPAARARGTTGQVVTISGTGFQPGAAVKFSGTGITVAATSVTDPATINVQVSVGASATLGARDVTVTNPDTGAATCAGCFTVNPRPTVGTLSPASGPRGTVGQVVQVPGTGFQPGLTVTFSGTGVTATVVAVTPTAITLAVDIAAGATTGQRSITVTNPDAGAVTKGTAYRVT